MLNYDQTKNYCKSIEKWHENDIFRFRMLLKLMEILTSFGAKERQPIHVYVNERTIIAIRSEKKICCLSTPADRVSVKFYRIYVFFRSFCK